MYSSFSFAFLSYSFSDSSLEMLVEAIESAGLMFSAEFDPGLVLDSEVESTVFVLLAVVEPAESVLPAVAEPSGFVLPAAAEPAESVSSTVAEPSELTLFDVV